MLLKLYLILGCLIGTAAAFTFLYAVKLYLILGCLIGTVEKRADGCIQILSPYGFLILDSSGNFVKPIEGAPAYSIRAVNGVDFSENSSAVISLCLKWNDKYYLVFFENATFKNGLIGVYYDKIWVNFFLRNESPIYYASINTATKELLDGTLLNSDTVTISVDVSGNGGGE